MGFRSLIALVSLMAVSALAAVGCSKDTQKVAPDARGKRGESCLARNDCETGLACLGNICAKNEFNIDVSAKQCTRVECSEDTDCCGDKPTDAPAKCKNREQICNPANSRIAGCVQTTCTSDAVCMGGTCPMGICQGTGQNTVQTACETATDCPVIKNTCVIPVGGVSGSCSATFGFCDAADPCPAVTPATCSLRSCNCQNPLYDPADPICADADCVDVCTLRCEDSLCLQDKSCKADNDCVAVGLKTCDSGRCVECAKNADCDVDNEETCQKGLCHKPCTQNEECGLFEQCITKKGDPNKGDCLYVGCQSDRECILAASRGQVSTGGTANPGVSSGGDDPRLFKCLPSEGDSKINVCKIPCENDGSCGQFQVCTEGFCKFVGCNTNEECRDYLGIANQATTDAKPYITTAICAAPGAPTGTTDTSAGGSTD